MILHVLDNRNSVVDYSFTPHDNLKYVKAFYVKRVKDILCEMDVNPTSSIPDHSLLNFVDMLTENSKVQNIELEPCSYGKDYKVSNIPPDFMNNFHCKKMQLLVSLTVSVKRIHLK